MTRLTLHLGIGVLAIFLGSNALAQTFARPPANSSDNGAQLQALTKKIEEQNAKIDTLSQQILKLEQQITNLRPGMMIGEATPPPSAATAAPPAEAPRPGTANNTHTVSRGETLTSIAKMYNVTVSELQKFNHIENDRKLQIGQTISIPAPPASAPAASPSD